MPTRLSGGVGVEQATAPPTEFFQSPSSAMRCYRLTKSDEKLLSLCGVTSRMRRCVADSRPAVITRPSNGPALVGRMRCAALRCRDGGTGTQARFVDRTRFLIGHSGVLGPCVSSFSLKQPATKRMSARKTSCAPTESAAQESRLCAYLSICLTCETPYRPCVSTGCGCLVEGSFAADGFLAVCKRQHEMALSRQTRRDPVSNAKQAVKQYGSTNITWDEAVRNQGSHRSFFGKEASRKPE
jgi:hypothetical protein